MAGFKDNPWVAPFGASTDEGFATAMGQGYMAAPGQFAQSFANLYDSYNKGYGSYNQAMAGLGNSYAQNYGAMAGGIGQLANALGNTWNNAQANNPYASSAEAARQMAIGQLGSAALGAYGNIGVAGMDAWARNQNGYQQALAGMTSANQAAVSGLGGARYGALSNLGGAAAKYGIGQEVAGAIPGMFSEGDYSAYSPGSGGGTGSSGGAGWGALDALRQDINSSRELDALGSGLSAGMGSLNYDQAIARNYPRQQINDSFGHLMSINRMNLDESSRGMDQFYENYGPYQGVQTREGQTIPTGSLLGALTGGYADSSGRITGVQDDMRSGFSGASDAYGAARQEVADLYRNSIGNMFQSAEEKQQEQWRLEDAAKERRQRLTDQLYSNVIPWADRNKYVGTAPSWATRRA